LKRTRIPTEQEAGWIPKPGSMFWRRQNILPQAVSSPGLSSQQPSPCADYAAPFTGKTGTRANLTLNKQIIGERSVGGHCGRGVFPVFSWIRFRWLYIDCRHFPTPGHFCSRARNPVDSSACMKVLVTTADMTYCF